MKEKTPFIFRKYCGLRPFQWVIFIGVAMIVVPNIILGIHLRPGQWLMSIGATGLLVLQLTERK